MRPQTNPDRPAGPMTIKLLRKLQLKKGVANSPQVIDDEPAPKARDKAADLTHRQAWRKIKELRGTK